MAGRIRAFLLGLMFLWGPAQAGIPPKDTLIVGITQFPATLHPAIDTMLAKSYILGFVRRPLTAYDAHWRLVCLMCERLPTFANGLAKIERRPDGKTGVALTVALKPGASWADGVPVGSDDILLGWEVGRHPESGVAAAETYRRITAIDVIDGRTVTLHLDRISFDYNSLGEFKILPAHIERQRFQADPARYHDTTAYDRDPALAGLWDGPYRVVKIVPGQEIQLERNPFWAGHPPAIAHVTVRVIENTAALEATILTGGVDMVAGELGLSLEQALAFGQRHPADFVITTTPSLVYEHLDLNLDNAMLADVRVRRALSLGLDRDTISQSLFDRRQPPATSFVPPSDPAYDPHAPALPYDPAQAAALLDQAGFALHDGWRRDAAGQIMAFDLLTTSGNRSRQLVAEIIQAQWRQLGILVRVKLEPPRIFFGQTVTKRRFAHMAMFAWYSAPESVPRSILRSTEIPKAENGWAGENYTGYANPAMDALIDRIETETDFAKRQPMWRQMQALYNLDLPAIPLFFKSDAHIWPKDLHGITPTGHEDQSPLWAEEWYWGAP